MPKAPVLGAAKKTVTLDADVFGAAFNGPLVHEVVVAELAARRQGTHATRTRGMVSGGGAKPWRQKGTGRARSGTSRSPLWTGGGTVFGPSPRHYTVKVNRKARRAALRSVLSVHAERGSIAVLDPAGFDAPSTKVAAGLLEGRLGGSVLVVITQRPSAAGTGDHEEQIAGKSFRNLERVNVVTAASVGVADIVGAAQLVVTEGALGVLTELARKPVAAGAVTPAKPARAVKASDGEDAA